MGYQPSQPSWSALQRMRRHGERPVGGVWLVQDDARRMLLRSRSLYAIRPPATPEAWLAGLDVFLLASRSEAMTDLAQRIGFSYPRFFALEWEGEAWQTVIDPNFKH